jgi:hypothetical protein
MESKQQEIIPFIKYHAGLSLFFHPVEMVFALQMANYEYLKSNGYRISLSKSEYALRMGMKEYTFEQCVRRFIKLKLLDRKYNARGNKVFYSFNMELYGKLIGIIAQAQDRDRLLAFFDRLKKESRSIESISEEEILVLKA